MNHLNFFKIILNILWPFFVISFLILFFTEYELLTFISFILMILSIIFYNIICHNILKNKNKNKNY